MGDEPKKDAIESIKASGTLLSTVFKLLNVLEALLPALLVAWANHLRSKNNALKSKLAIEKIEGNALRRKINEKSDTTHNILARFFKSRQK